MERAAASHPIYKASGIVSRLLSGNIEITGLSRYVSLGDIVSIETPDGPVLSEVASIESGVINVSALSSRPNIKLGALATSLHRPLAISPDASWLGRVINPLGEPIDGAGALQPGAQSFPMHKASPPPLARQRLGQPVTTGVKVIDLFSPICAGQRLGIFAGSGVGKSTLLAMLSRAKDFDVTVLALVGERGREVREFLDDILGDNRKRCVTVVATADESPMMRRIAPHSAMSIAEYFRDRGKQVLLIIDSVTRYAHAMRELGLSAQEPPIARGYPPSVFSSLARLLERAGTGREGAGTMTALVSVLVDGDDHNDPVADATRGILDGHVVLDRSIASQGRYPAVDPLASISRTATRIRTPQQMALITELIGLIQRFEESRDLRMIGGYRPGTDMNLDRAVQLVPLLYDALRQGPDDPPIADVFGYLAGRLDPSAGNSPPERLGTSRRLD
jgi:flagellum-specific ATP synthase